MNKPSLESLLASAGNPVTMLRNSQLGAYVYPVVPSEFSNWRDEQRAWRTTAVLFDQSHHMAELTAKGPDALKLMSYCTINSFSNFAPGKAKQMVPCSHEGFVIGDGILFYLAPDELLFVGRAPFGQLDPVPRPRPAASRSTMIRDDRSPSHPRGKAVTRRHYRFQVQGPECGARCWRRSTAGPIPDVKFFTISIRSTSRAARCAHSGTVWPARRAWRLWGPYAEGDEIRDALHGSRARIRPHAGGLARLCQQHAGVGLDSITAAGRLHRRSR